MENLTHYQRLVLEKLLPPLKKTEPYVELLRVSILFRKIKEIESDRVLFDQFKTIINNQLCFHLKSLDEFYELGRLKDNYEKLVKEFIDDNIDADENDFIEKYISSQNEIIEKTFKYSIEIDDYESLELTQFVQKYFFDDFIRSSKKKIKFLESKLNLLSTSKVEVNEVNPYPLIFTSFKVYSEFLEYTEKHIIDYYLDYSYLKKRLENDNLIHRMKDRKFMRFIFNDMKLLNQRNFDDYTQNKNGLSSLNKSSSANRENNFNNIFTKK